MRRSTLSGLLLSLAMLAGLGCINPQSYVDPKLPRVELATISRTEPKVLALEVQFFRAGKRLPKVDSEVRDKVRLHLLACGAVKEILPTPDPVRPVLKIDLDNVGDTGSAVAKGIGTGLTLGLVGSMVTDGYVFTATLERPGLPPVKKVYNHAIHTTVGNKKGPEGLTPMPVTQAFDQVMEALVLNMVKDLQAEQAL